MKYLYLVALILGSLLLHACDQSGNGGSGIKGDLDRTGSAQKITIKVYDTKTAMQKAKAEASNRAIDPTTEGWSIWSPNNEELGCTVHVVKLKSGTDNSGMTTWGHELAHCMYGTYHKEL